MGMPRHVPLALVLAVAGCRGETPQPVDASQGPPAAAQSPVQRLMPLEDGTVYSYATEAENTGERGVLVMRIRRPRPGMAEIVVGGRVQRVLIAPGQLELATGGYLLKGPIEPGATWRGQAGQVSVTETGKSIQAPAGQFVSCVETVEVASTGEVQKKITTVYCPDVGIVLLDVEGTSSEGYARETAVLESFGPAVDLGADEVKVIPGN